MRFETYIAKRYLFSKHKLNFITILSFLSIGGITIGVAALIIVLSVFNGFGNLVKNYLINFDPHLRVEIISPDVTLNDYIKLESLVKKIPSLKAYSPFVSSKVLAYRNGKTQVVVLKGIKTESNKNFYGIEKSLLYGNYDFKSYGSLPKIMLGLPLANNLEVIVGDTVTIVSPSGIEKVITQFASPKQSKFIISGIYYSYNNKYDESFMFSDITIAQDLLGYKTDIQGYDILLNDIDQSDKAKEYLSKHLNPDLFSVNTWFDFHKDLYTVMKIERWAAFLILLLIIAVASFNVLGSLSMSVVEKNRDIGVLKTIGAKNSSIKKIFIRQGLLIGIIGTVLGMLIAYLVCYLQINYNIYPLDPTRFKINSLPVKIQVSDFIYVGLASLFLSTIASIFPSKRASQTDPIDAIKWE